MMGWDEGVHAGNSVPRVILGRIVMTVPLARAENEMK